MLNCLRNAPSSSVSTTARFPHSSPGRSLRVLSSVPHARDGTQNDRREWPPRRSSSLRISRTCSKSRCEWETKIHAPIRDFTGVGIGRLGFTQTLLVGLRAIPQNYRGRQACSGQQGRLQVRGANQNAVWTIVVSDGQ